MVPLEIRFPDFPSRRATPTDRCPCRVGGEGFRPTRLRFRVCPGTIREHIFGGFEGHARGFGSALSVTSGSPLPPDWRRFRSGGFDARPVRPEGCALAAWQRPVSDCRIHRAVYRFRDRPNPQWTPIGPNRFVQVHWVPGLTASPFLALGAYLNWGNRRPKQIPRRLTSDA